MTPVSTGRGQGCAKCHHTAREHGYSVYRAYVCRRPLIAESLKLQITQLMSNKCLFYVLHVLLKYNLRFHNYTLHHKRCTVSTQAVASGVNHRQQGRRVTQNLEWAR